MADRWRPSREDDLVHVTCLFLPSAKSGHRKCAQVPLPAPPVMSSEPTATITVATVASAHNY